MFTPAQKPRGLARMIFMLPPGRAVGRNSRVEGMVRPAGPTCQPQPPVGANAEACRRAAWHVDGGNSLQKSEDRCGWFPAIHFDSAALIIIERMRENRPS